MFQKYISELERRGIIFDKGLEEPEFMRIEKIYDISFPYAYKEFLSEAMPVSDGFYNWRNFTDNNTYMIKSMLELPFKNVKKYISEIFFYEDEYKELNEKDRNSEIIRRLSRAPKLIPIFAHRYVPIYANDNPPVLSIHGIDIIYYGINLQDYFNKEFHIGEMVDESIGVERIPFWSELM